MILPSSRPAVFKTISSSAHVSPRSRTSTASWTATSRSLASCGDRFSSTRNLTREDVRGARTPVPLRQHSEAQPEHPRPRDRGVPDCALRRATAHRCQPVSRLPGGTRRSPSASLASSMRSCRRAILCVPSSSLRTRCLPHTGRVPRADPDQRRVRTAAIRL